MSNTFNFSALQKVIANLPVTSTKLLTQHLVMVQLLVTQQMELSIFE